MYKLKIYPKFSLTGKEENFDINSEEDLISMLQLNSYDTSEEEIINLIKNGGTNEGFNGPEFTIEVIQPEIEIDKTAFNDAELFIKEYKNYLIGKQVLIEGKKDKITKVYKCKNVNSVCINLKKNEDGFSVIGTEEFKHDNYFQKFIDGEEIISDDNVIVQLILQKEIESENELINKPEYKYYVVNENNKILSGFEYKEDAVWDAGQKQIYGEKVSVLSKKDLAINPEDNSNWLINNHDWDIIERCVNAGVEQNDYSEREAKMYIDGFKENGKWLPVIKARLIYCLRSEQNGLINSFTLSNVERINETCDKSCRIQKELKRIISMEK